MQTDRRRKFGASSVIDVQQVPFDAQVAEQCRDRAEPEAVRAAGGVRASAAPMCAPISSGGINIDGPRWIVWRSSASLQSLAQTRSVRRRISKSTRPPPLAQLSNSTVG